MRTKTAQRHSAKDLAGDRRDLLKHGLVSVTGIVFISIVVFFTPSPAEGETTPQPDAAHLLRAESDADAVEPDLFSDWTLQLKRRNAERRVQNPSPQTNSTQSSLPARLEHRGKGTAAWWLLPIALLLGLIGGVFGARMAFRRQPDKPEENQATPPSKSLKDARVLTVSSVPGHGLLLVLDIKGEELTLWREEGENAMTLLSRKEEARSEARHSALQNRAPSQNKKEKRNPHAAPSTRDPIVQSNPGEGGETQPSLNEIRHNVEGKGVYSRVSSGKTQERQNENNTLTDEELDSLLSDLMDKVRGLKPLSRQANEA